MVKPREAVDNLKEYFSNHGDISLAFLFGSQAKERISLQSDFDIAIWPKEEMDINGLNKMGLEIEKLLHKNVDLVLLPKARPTVAWAALRGKKLLIRDFKLFLKLFLEVSREAEDIQDFILDTRRLKRRLVG